MKRNYFLKTVAAFCAMSASLCSLAQNASQSVAQVTSSVTVSTATDYHITSATPFATTGSVNLTHEDATVCFNRVKPSEVISTYLKNVLINGEKAVNDGNCRVAIHLNGAIVYAHPNSSYNPLTIYSEKDLAGESRSNFTPRAAYRSLGQWDNKMQSFKLKRGYMVTLATNSDGQGYSRIWIAQDKDIEVNDIDRYLRGKVSFIRVFPWNNVTKKGNAGGDINQMNALNVTWFYDWAANDINYADYEYVQHHHHEGWPSWGTINSHNFSTHVLGNNEPDNAGDDREEYIARDQIEEKMFTSGTWKNAYNSGMRVGSPAMSGDVSGWLVDFMNLCKTYNCRIDFVAAHCYWYSPGSSFNSNVNWFWSLFNRPVWITEFNYGANWTNWASDDHSASDANQNIELNGLSDIVTALENNPYMERYAIYNWVEDCRAVYLNGKLTKAGEWYANLQSKSAYSGQYDYIPTWTFSSPTDLEVSYSNRSHRASFTWTHLNGEQSDSTYLERMDPDSKEFKPIAKFYGLNTTNCSYNYDDLTGLSGMFTYRVRNFDSDGKTRETGTVTVTVGGTEGDANGQYGKVSVGSTETTTVDYAEEFSASPAVFLGLISNKNPNTGLAHVVSSALSMRFAFALLPWQKGKSQDVSKPEDISYMVLPYGVHHYGDLTAIVASASASSDTVEVEFDEPFEEGVVPVVVTELRPIIKSTPIMTKVFDITNRGFKCVINYEAGLSQRITAEQTLSYIAITPGQGKFNDSKVITAGVADEPLYGNLFRKVVFDYEDENGESHPYYFKNPLVFGALQDNQIKAMSLLRLVSTETEEKELEDGTTQDLVTAAYVKRQVDESSNVEFKDISTGEHLGWIVISDDNEWTTDIDDVVRQKSENTFQVSSENGIILVEGATDYDVYSINGTKVASNATQTPGVYIVKVGKTAKKVMVK